MTNTPQEKSSLLGQGRTGLLVIDMQEKLWPHIYEREFVLKRVGQAIAVAGHLDIPIMVTEQYTRGLGSSLPEVRSALDAAGATAPVEKVAFSCFGEPSFVQDFEARCLQTLVVVGIEAHVCVMQTTLDALDRGIDVFVIAEAIGSRNLDHKREAIQRMSAAGAIIGSVEMLAFEVMRSAEHPAFRKVQRVIL